MSHESSATTSRASFPFLAILLIVVASALILGSVAPSETQAQGIARVKVCHRPPGTNAKFHTITVSERVLDAHLAHGDLPGSCSESCDVLCDDGNACSVDACDPEAEVCLTDHPPVNCDDGNPCTIETCDPILGCQSAPLVCDDGDACTVDACNPLDGSCVATPLDCGPLGVCLPETGLCDYPCDGITCEPTSQCHQPGQCVLPGECLPGDPVPDGTACDDGDSATSDDQCVSGTCSGVPTGCPCFSAADIQAAASQCATTVTATCSILDPYYLLIACDPGGTVPPGVLGIYLVQTADGGYCSRQDIGLPDPQDPIEQSGLTATQYQACVDAINASGFCQ